MDNGAISDEAEQVRDVYQRMAPGYDRMIVVFEWLLLRGGRQWLCSQARGEVLELAVGTGRNLPLYGADTQVTGVELSPVMLELARGRANGLPRTVDLRVGDAQDLALRDASFDTVVFSLALCSIPDEYRAVAEAFRVLRPGGRLLALEHVRSPVGWVRAGQRVLEPLFLRVACDHLLREPLDAVRDAGFEVERLERSKLGIVERLTAHKPPTRTVDLATLESETSR